MTLSPDYTNVNYRPGGSSNGYQTFNVYVPPAEHVEIPTNGWPCVIVCRNTGYTASSKAGSLTGALESLVEWGVVVVDMTMTITDTGDPSITGGGMWWDPDNDSTEWDDAATDDDIPQKDVIWAIQKVRDEASTYGIDTGRIGLYAFEDSAAATVALWAAFRADMADAGGNSQEQKSSRVRAVAVRDPVWYHRVTQDSASNEHFRDEGTPTSKASTFGDASTSHRTTASPQHEWNNADSSEVDVLCGVTGTPSSRNWSITTNNLPSIGTNALADPSDSWHGFMLGHYLRDRVTGSYLAAARRLIVYTATWAHAKYGADRYVPDADATLYELRWLLQRLRGPRASAETWDVDPEWSVRVEDQQRNVRAPGEVGPWLRRRAGLSVAVGSGISQPRRWRLGWANALPANVTRVRAIRTAQRGGAVSFDFEPPEESGYVPARIVEFNSRKARNVYRMEVTVEEDLQR